MTQTINWRTTLLWLVASTLLLMLTLVGAAAGTSPELDVTSKVDASLLRGDHASDDVEFLVLFRSQADLSATGALRTKETKGQYVYDTLRQSAQASQVEVRRILDAAEVPYRAYWINNMIWVRGNALLIQQLAQQPEVIAIRPNPAVKLDLPAQQMRLLQNPDELSDEYPWNLETVKAPAVWAMGYQGQGVVIGGQDTGYDWTHPALQPHYRGWNGQTADHDYNWHDAIHEDNPNTVPGNSCGYNSAEPCDDGYHGTHTMGTMVGDDGQGTRTGMAPSAGWIGCRNMEQGWGTPATYTECFEWFIAPYPVGGDSFTDGDPARAPHVINNSWSCPPSEGCTPDILKGVVEAVRAAGIVTVQSAGNSGSSCQSVTTPAAIYDASFTVGAVSSSGLIAGFSSRGPGPDGILKPDIAAPGVDIVSTLPGSGYGSLSGTSMAAPHVAGMVALLLSANPSLAGNVDAIEQAITQTANPRSTSQGCGGDLPDAVPNNVYGWGIIDVEAAVDASPIQPTPTATPTASPTPPAATPTPTSTPGAPMPYRHHLPIVVRAAG